MSDTIPADLLMRSVDDSLDYTGTYGNVWGFYFAQGRTVVTASLAASHDYIGEAIAVGALGVSLGANQAVWVISGLSRDEPVGWPYLILCYVDDFGAQIMQRRKLAIYDSGAVGPAGGWDNCPVEESRFMLAILTPWMNPPGDAATIEQLLRERGHYIST